MANRENNDLVLERAKAVLGKISASAAENDELAAIALGGTSDEWMRGEHPEAIEDRGNRLRGRAWVGFAQEQGEPLEVVRALQA